MIVPKKAARLILYVGVLTLLTGCASRTTRIVATPAGSANNDYLDIQAGWRLTAVTPILKSGGYVLKTQDNQQQRLHLSAGKDFVGYEFAHYEVKGPRGGRVRVEFNSAEVTKEGKTQPQPHSIAPLFQVARRPTYLAGVVRQEPERQNHEGASEGIARVLTDLEVHFEGLPASGQSGG